MATRIVSYSSAFLSDVSAAFGRSVRDAGEEAARRRGAPSDTHGDVTGFLEGRIGSDRPYAKAQERGAFIRPRGARALRFATGEFRMHARIKAKRYLRATGRRWGHELLVPRLREVAR